MLGEGESINSTSSSRKTQNLCTRPPVSRRRPPPARVGEAVLWKIRRRTLDGFCRNGHADLLCDPERPLPGSLEMPEYGRAIALGGCFIRRRHGTDRLVLLGRPGG
jgi:hypothetical protein